MSNIPANDTGVKLVPFATAWCEWLVTLAGAIATCVEASEMIVDHNATAGRIPVSAAEDTSLADDLIARGEASANGATNAQAASAQMTQLGVPNDYYDAAWFASAANDFVSLARAAIDRGQAVLFGVYAAHNLHDDWTNTNTDAGVDGHGLALVGYDATGFIVADPNTAQAESGNFVHYTAATLKGAEGGFPSMVIPRGALLVSNVARTYANGEISFSAHDGLPAVSFGGQQAYFAESNRQSAFPLVAESYDASGDSIVVWSDGLKSVGVKDATGTWTVTLQDASAELAAFVLGSEQVATLTAQVAALKQQIASAPPATPPDPVAVACRAALQQLKSALGEL